MNNKGQVGVIVTILIISILVAVLIIVQTYYVPKWMKDREAEHMDDVMNQFARLKYSIDLQAMERSSSPLINSITLGSKELPYFVSSRAFGSLNILSQETSNFGITITGHGREKEQFFDDDNDNISYVSSLSILKLKIENLTEGDIYNISSSYFKISARVEQYRNFLQVRLKVLSYINGNITVFNDSVTNGYATELKWINLMDPVYNFSTEILPEIHDYFNLSINLSTNASSHGKFIIKGTHYGEEATIQSYEASPGDMGEIKYSSENAYFVDQDYIYEGGAVVLSQNTGSSILYPPMINIENASIPYINFTVVDINGIAGKTGAAGYGTYSIRTNYTSFSHWEAIGNITFNISSDYIIAWKNYIITKLNESGIQYTYSEGSNFIEFVFPRILMSIYKVRVSAQIGPGWVE